MQLTITRIDEDTIQIERDEGLDLEDCISMLELSLTTLLNVADGTHEAWIMVANDQKERHKSAYWGHDMGAASQTIEAGRLRDREGGEQCEE